MEVAIIVATVVGVILLEAAAFLIYKVIKMNKDLEKTIENVNGLSECVLEMAKRMPSVDVIEEEKVNSSDFDFPGV